jgi:mannose-1-phosphate guanylyltransferase/mannose-6-phosphate isomerase
LNPIGNILPVLLCGGAGTRLWPLLGERTLLQEAAVRTSGIADAAPPLVVCGEGPRFMVADQLRRIGLQPSTILVEPEGRGTAPALTLAAVHSLSEDDPVLLALPSDHAVSEPRAFQRALERGAALARNGYIVTFGVPATSAETMFGYLRAGRPVVDINGGPRLAEAADAHFVDAFVEKPDAAAAQAYVSSQQYRWNAGIFAVRASVWIDAIGCYNRAMLAACERAYRNGVHEQGCVRVHAASFAGCPADSIDYAVMERITQDAASFPAVVVNLDAGWTDVAAGASSSRPAGQPGAGTGPVAAEAGA